MQNSTTQKPIRQAENEILEALAAHYDQAEEILEVLQDIRTLLRYASAERHELADVVNRRAGELFEAVALARRDMNRNARILTDGTVVDHQPTPKPKPPANRGKGRGKGRVLLSRRGPR